ncbi:hypothetical protein ACB092_06G168400 [Castanea dentata]
MSNPRAAAGDGEGESKDNTITKAAGIFVFSGIALSILKAIIPLKKPRNTETQSANESPLTESTQLIQVQPPRPLPPHEPFVKKPITYMDHNLPEVPELSHKTIEIAKGDTLWGLSRKFGVSVNAIKEANGLKGDTIYAGKKLIIP